jgi:enolase
VDLSLTSGALGRAIVPSGASTGEYEALELRDKDPKRYHGKGVLKPVSLVKDRLSKLLVGKSFTDIRSLDQALLDLDPSTQKSELGGNTILGVSLAYAHAVAAAEKKPLYFLINEWAGKKPSDLKLPTPFMNILNGGVHADNGLEIQEFMIVPHGLKSFPESLRAGCEIFHTLKADLHAKGLSTAVGDEGGFAPRLESNEKALELICTAIEKSGYRLGEQVSVALDVAASSFFSQSKKQYEIKWNGKNLPHSSDLIEMYSKWVGRFPILSIEDPLDENDWGGWSEITQVLGGKTQLVGDDLFVTQSSRLQTGVDKKVANAILIKVNQVGSLSETLDTMALAEKNRYRSMVSHRSGESEDTTIAHLAVGTGCGQIKTGSVSRGERTAKYNELLRIYEALSAN